MTEFLTENARRAYPLEREWPDGMDAWSRVLVDAAVATDATLNSGRMALLSAERSGSQLTFTVGAPGTVGIPVTFDRAAWTGGRTAVAYASGVAAEDDTALPPYQATLDYVQSTGQQYVDTGVNPVAAPTVVADMQILNNDDRDYWGNGNAGVNATSIYIADFANKRLMYYRYASGSAANPVCTSSGARETWRVGKEISINGNSACFTSPNTYAYDARQHSIRVFASARGNPSVFKLYSFKLYTGDDLVRHLIPVLDWHDEPRLFDLVTQTYMAHADLTAAHVPLLGGAVVAVTPLDPVSAGRVKAFLTLNVEAVDALLADPDEEGGDVNVPFVMRCSDDAQRRVTSITAQGARACTTPVFSTTDADRVEKSVGPNAHAVLRADDGVDLEVTGMAPLVGDVLRVSALAAPEATELDEEPVDMMIRGDDCFTVETIPGAKVSSGGTVVAREEADGDGGVVRIGTACKPCCQCEDYKDAVDMLRPAETKAVALEGELDGIKDAYESALAAFASAKQAAEAAVNSLDNVRLAISTAGSSAVYTGSDAKGTRQRFTATLLVENLTMLTAVVSNLSITTDAAYAATYTAVKTVESGSRTLQPGATLVVVTTFRTTESVNSNALDSPPTVNASCTVALYKPNNSTPVASGTKSI